MVICFLNGTTIGLYLRFIHMEKINAGKSSIGWTLEDSYTQLPTILFSAVKPTGVKGSKPVCINYRLAEELGLLFTPDNLDAVATQLVGNTIPECANPIAQAYMGHQFGYPNMLGDGRAILLGEQITPLGKRVDVQLKGSGATPYSRRGDGRATLSACLREYIISEAMFALGIPTSRSLAVIATNEPVYREQLHEGAVLTRIMSSHIRVGTFEFASRHLDTKDFTIFLQYVINRHYPTLTTAENPALSFLQAVIEKQIDLIVHWMRVGFIHGVMNTDNMSIAGETFDYGPCAFMNAYNPATVYSSIDTNGRYAFGNQPSIAQWNLAVLASALIPLIDDVPEKAIEKAKEVINQYPNLYAKRFRSMMKRKLGLEGEKEGDIQLISDILQWMEMTYADYTNTFAYLTYATAPNDERYEEDGFKLWYLRWKERIALNPSGETFAIETMKKANPVFIPRNHQVEAALESATLGNDLSLFERLLYIIQTPYSNQDSYSAYKLPPLQGEAGYKTFCNT